ncbi:hypothetical protein ABK040_003587 [Willaertia magna]
MAGRLIWMAVTVIIICLFSGIMFVQAFSMLNGRKLQQLNNKEEIIEDKDDDITKLQVGKELRGEIIHLNSNNNYNTVEKLYEIIGLTNTGKKYEVRISYPSFMPAIFNIHLLSEREVLERRKRIERNGKKPYRTLMNVEKIIFRESNQLKGEVNNNNKRFVLVEVKRESISFRSDIQNEDISYNIVVEELLFGFIPKDSISLGIVALLLIVSLWFFIVPFIQNKLFLWGRRY